MTSRTFDWLRIAAYAALLLVALLFLLAEQGSAQNVVPFQGLGSAQFFDNNGKPLTTGVLYSYQAGTTSQQATYTDATGTAVNPNPMPFTSGARASIWLSSGKYYKFVLCSQNDGAACAPADVLFSVDQVPGNLNGTNASSGSTFTGTFLSGTGTDATSGIVRLASPDLVCWRNNANSANLCIGKDVGDVLYWSGGTIKLPEVPCSATGVGYDFLCADSGSHRPMMSGNGGGMVQIVAAGHDINSQDQVVELHWGTGGTPLNPSGPLTGQYIYWDGAHLSGGDALTKSGNTTEYCSVSGALTSGHVVKVDASGNCVDGGALPVIQVMTGQSSCTVPDGASFNTCTSTFNWPGSFADTNYAVSCGGGTPSNPRVMLQGITAQTVNTITVQFVTNGSTGGSMTGISCTGTHP